MKITYLATSILLLIASLILVQKAYSLPTKVDQQATVLEYRHQGSFDYSADVKPSYFYADYQAPQPVPQIPVKFIDDCEVTFTFKSEEQLSRQVQVDAILENTPSWQKKVALIPVTDQTGDFVLNFPLDFEYFQNLAATIDTEIGGASASAYFISLEVTVSQPPAFDGQINQNFTQVLPIKVSKYFVEMGSDLVQRQDTSVGTFDYTIGLKPNSLFSDATLKPPAPVPSDVRVTPADPIFLQLVDLINMHFNYQFVSDKPITQGMATVQIDAILEVPNKWSKTFIILPTTMESESFTIAFALDLKRFTEIANIIQTETGISSSPYNLNITARVSVNIGTDLGTIKEDFTQTIQTSLSAGILNWRNLAQSKSGSIKKMVSIDNQKNILWLSLSRARIIFPIAAGIFFVLLIFFAVRYFVPGPTRITSVNRQAEQVAKKYKGLIIEVKELPVVNPGEAVVWLSSLDDLMKTAEGLLKPVLHKATGQRHTYCVLDAATRYEYCLGQEDTE
jgi:hypothetical protein